MSLWFRVRGVGVLLGAMAATLGALTLPVSAAAATPSPTGATLAAACFVALAAPVAVGWGCARGDPQLESTGVRPTRVFDFLLAVGSVGAVSAAGLLMFWAGVAPAGAIAARAGLVYLGLLLLAQPMAGWRVAAVAPSVYLLLVAVVGRGEDIAHPAPWAWIAADGGSRSSWLLSAVVLGTGAAAYSLLKPKLGVAGDE
jgi:hypothetical protein